MRQLSIFDKILVGINVLLAAFLFLACLIPYIKIAAFPIMSLVSLAVPVLVSTNLLFMAYWAMRKKRIFFLSLLVLVISYFTLGTFYKFKFSEEDILEEDLSIMTFNVRGFNRHEQIDNPNLDKDIIRLVKEQDPDIVCFQEFRYHRGKEFGQYPYIYLSYERGKKRTLQAILSKYPIASKGSLNFPDSFNNGVYADIIRKNDTIRIYNLHLESLRIIPNAETVTKGDSGKLLKRMERTFSKQLKQAQIFDLHRKNSPYPNILCGDLNNTQFSWVYGKVKGDMQDTFSQQGSGFGSTYDFAYFPLRIDFIMADEAFKVKAHKNFNQKLSDHFPVMASVRLERQ